MESLSRRMFVGGLGALIASGALATAAGCSPQSATDMADTGTTDTVKDDIVPDSTVECDILVIGAGASGLTAALQAAQLEARTICLEATGDVGGNAFGIEGIFGVDSSMCKAQNLDVSAGALIRKEMDQSQYRCNSLALTDLVHASGENIDWMLDNGILFDRVDTYVGDLPVFHYFTTGSGAESFIAPLRAAAEKAGAEFVFNAHADALATDENGRVCGAFATDANGVTRYDAKAVIVATGGFADNIELRSQIGYTEDTPVFGAPGRDGSGHTMCIEAGAASNLRNACGMGGVWVDGISFARGLSSVLNIIWVNENGERFVNEDLGMENPMGGANVLAQQERVYGLFDQALMEEYLAADSDNFSALLAGGEVPDQHEVLQQAIEKGIAFEAATLADLAAQIEVDEAMLQATVDRFNGFCAEGDDRDYGKGAPFLVPYGEGPFYAIAISNGLATTLGSVRTDRNFSALDAEGNPIEGLYVVGVEGAMLWASLYTMNISGSACANNVHSGRIAAQHAAKTCLA